LSLLLALHTLPLKTQVNLVIAMEESTSDTLTQGGATDDDNGRVNPTDTSTKRIRDIEAGVDLADIEVIPSSTRAQEIYSNLVKSAAEEILWVFPTVNAFIRQEKIGVIQLAKEAAKQKNVKVRILVPANSLEQIELLDTVIRNAKRLKQITDDIFDVTRIESHSLNLNKEQFDLNEQIKTVINDIKNQINMRYNNNAVKLLFQTKRKEGNGVFIKADKIRIYEVISNLLKNAIKFTKEGTISITTEEKKKKKKTGKGGEVIVKIKDTGIGLPSNILPNLFSKFATGSSFKRGIGLGLFISKSIVEAHGGRIWAQTNPDGKGATFAFNLPLSK
jgi:signal transduction histidine kinase